MDAQKIINWIIWGNDWEAKTPDKYQHLSERQDDIYSREDEEEILEGDMAVSSSKIDKINEANLN